MVKLFHRDILTQAIIIILVLLLTDHSLAMVD